MNINEMQAGAEMDRLVAEKVMGWILHQTETPTGLRAWYMNNDNTRPLKLYAAEDYPDNGGAIERFAPSTNIAHAWQVVEHLRLSRGLGRMITFDPDAHGEQANVCVFRALRDSPGKRSMGIARDLPLAICRAALKAKS